MGTYRGGGDLVSTLDAISEAQKLLLDLGHAEGIVGAVDGGLLQTLAFLMACPILTGVFHLRGR
jgi:hypothetical protein